VQEKLEKAYFPQNGHFFMSLKPVLQEQSCTLLSQAHYLTTLAKKKR
jgi:hypothetical protein